VLPLVIPSWPAGVRGVFTTRAGGVSMPPYAELNLGGHVGDDPSAVRDNRALLARALGLEPGRIVHMDQVHGRDVAVVTSAPQRPPTVDALVTTTPGLAVTVLVADCVPVLLADGDAGVVAAVHAGRKGVELGVVPAALQSMVALGASPGRVHARLGPAIGPCCYDVPAEMQAAVAAAAPGAIAPESGGRSRSGRPSLDLRAGIEQSLRDAGVHLIAHSGGCTADEPEWFSYRRDRTTGRFAGLVWLEA
jgi:YfiH family protein